MPSSDLRARVVLVSVIAASVFHVSVGRAQSAPSPATAPPPAASPASRAFMSAGATTFALTYLASSLAATTDYYTDAATASARASLWVPVVGPFVALGNASSAGVDVLLVLDGLAQMGGLAMLGYGLATMSVGPVKTAGRRGFTFGLASLAIRGASGAAIGATF